MDKVILLAQIERAVSREAYVGQLMEQLEALDSQEDIARALLPFLLTEDAQSHG